MLSRKLPGFSEVRVDGRAAPGGMAYWRDPPPRPLEAEALGAEVALALADRAE